MTKSPGLSSDIDFIKEFEELRLKQKILIESLNKNHKSKEKDLLFEISSKLDFIVKIFQDSDDTDFNEKEFLETHFKEVSSKLDKISSSFEERFSKLEESIKNLNENTVNDSNAISEKREKIDSELETIEKDSLDSSELETTKQESPNVSPTMYSSENKTEETVVEKSEKKTESKDSLPPPVAPPQKASEEVEEKNSEKKEESKDSLPPPPDFSINEDKVEQLAKDSSNHEKKKGWFS